ncbi:MAG: phosphotransferase, partial [Muribaculaceae bacterium]|nr:phosphotransferase [Muribaculaceae bacterium]
YYRLYGEGLPAVIGTFGEDGREDECFINLSNTFRKKGLPVPEIYAQNIEKRIYLQEDLGSLDLLSFLKKNRNEGIDLAGKALRELVSLQAVPESLWRRKVINKPFSKRMVMWDLNYFKYDFLKPAGIPFDEEKLEEDFERFASVVANTDESLMGFMYRDFQSRNVMIKEGRPWFIDYQGGRRGPVIYDAVSFIWQAKANFTKEEREYLLTLYIEELSKVTNVNRFYVNHDINVMVLLRTLQVLGAYGFRGLVEKKAHFIESIPGALKNLSDILERGVINAYPELKKIAMQCVASRFAGKKIEKGLTLKIFSFSYKKGYPEDISGNGGGFMFDCRGMHNPGRYEEYGSLTGLDKPVIDFLEERGEVQDFVAKAVELVRPTIETYHRRGFTGLQVGFGCTGGQHRSVYCAQHFGEKIREQYPEIKVEIIHRERGVVG